MGKHLLTREERIRKAQKWRRYMNSRHHIEDKINAKREMEILKRMRIVLMYK